MARWTFQYPRVAVTPGPWGARARLALHLLRPHVAWRVGDLPTTLRPVHWPSGVTSLGVYRDSTGARYVRLRVPRDPAAAFRAWEATQLALQAAGLPTHPGGAVGFDVRDDLFDLGGTLLGRGAPRGAILDLPLLPTDREAPPQAGLTLSSPAGQSAGGAPQLLLPTGTDLPVTLALWVEQATDQGWSASTPLTGDGQVLLTFTRAHDIVTLTGIRLGGGAWAFLLERDTWTHLRKVAAVQRG